MEKILEKSGNFVRGKKWEPWMVYCIHEKAYLSIRSYVDLDLFVEI